jgi:hypothetical protein
MREATLGRLLLVKAVEETDRNGELLPLADRESATREVLRSEGVTTPAPGSGAVAPAGAGEARGPRMMRLLAERAERLFGPLAARYPVLNDILERSRLPAWFSTLVLGGSVAAGLVLASLDGTRRINILAFPFLGVIAWNLVVYVLVIVHWARDAGAATPVRRARPGWTQTAISRRLARLVDRTSQVHVRLGEVVSRYAADWGVVGGRLLSAHARTLLHLAAAALALGLVAGLYLRGVVFRYEAGWDSTFLGSGAVRSILGWIFGPAAALTGITLPSTEAAVAALRWTPEGGGGDAAPWIHLIAVTLALYVIAPRLLLAGLAGLDGWRWRRAKALPDALLAYARNVLGAAHAGHGSGEVVVVPYACDVSADTRRGLQRWLEAEFGPGARPDLRPKTPYGQEEELRRSLEAGDSTGAPPQAEGVILLMSLAATPETENHGQAIAAARDFARRAQPELEMRVVLDETAYVARLGGDGSLAGRIEERRELWRRFVRGYGLDAQFVNLAAAP